MMIVLVAPDKFKGSLSAFEAAKAIKCGIHKYDSTIKIITHPLADGGDGTMDILNSYFSLKSTTVLVKNPLFEDIQANYFYSIDTAYIEMASASGLLLIEKEKRDCKNATSYGTGQLILDAIQKGFRKIVLFIGGSATNDAGVGMAAALGYKFHNENEVEVSPTGKNLIHIKNINTDNVFFNPNEIEFTVVCDVENPLYGPNGAAHVYAAQKGASQNDIHQLDKGLQHFNLLSKQFFNADFSMKAGAGAAGGMGAGALLFLKASIKPGIEFVMNETKFEENFDMKIDLIVTGEGSVDKQTINGKVISGISDIANQKHIPVAILAGVVKDSALVSTKIKTFAIKSIIDVADNIDDAILNAESYLEHLSFELIAEFCNAHKN